MSTRGRPRFIAGAVCPACGEMDRLVVEGGTDAPLRRCVACGYKDEQRPAGSQQPTSRLDGGLQPATAEASRVVRILDPSEDPQAPGEDRKSPSNALKAWRFRRVLLSIGSASV